MLMESICCAGDGYVYVGLQSGGRTESILMSLPPRVQWHYGHQPVAGSPEERLLSHYLKPQDWLKGS